MVTGLELGLLAIVVIALVGAHRAMKTIKPLIVNAVVGLIGLLVASVVGFGVSITPIVVLVVALGGLPGAILVLLLAHLNLMFEPLALLLF
jgi:hypothetical protein